MKRLIAMMLGLEVAMMQLPLLPVSAAPASALLTGLHPMDENLVHLGADYLNPAAVLFDDQDKVPQSPKETSIPKEQFEATDRSHNWKPNHQSDYGDDSFYLDLGGNYVITGLCYLDTNGVNKWKVEAGTPFAWEEILSFSTDAYMTWKGIEITPTAPTRYLHFSTGCGDSGISELAIYGYLASPLTEEQLAITAPKPAGGAKSNLTAGGAVGFNAFIDDPMTAMFAGGNVREYHNLSWLIDKDGKVQFTQGTWGDMDAYYGALQAQGIDVIPCFQGGCSYIYGEEKYPEIAAEKGADTLNPESYAVHAQAMYQVAARYGSNPDVPLDTIQVADNSTPQVGLGLLSALENCNEPNKSWSGKQNYYTPYELAAMCSADYDGHEGRIPHAGVKQADPDFRLAMGGLVGTATLLDYLSEMKLWFDYHRSDGKFAVDIINVHIAPNAACPEDSNFRTRIQSLKAWIAENAPDTELWISEFEIPMSDCETEGMDNHDNEAYQEKYAQRVARTCLVALSEGVSRISKFQLRDEASGVYADSGLVTKKGEWSRKPAWYAVSCMKHVLRNADFVADCSTDTYCDLQFKDRVTGDIIDCCWLPTNEGKQLEIPWDAASYVYLTCPSAYAEGTTTLLTEASVMLTETPVYLTTSKQPVPVVNGRHNRISPAALCMTADNSTEICDMTAKPKDGKLNQFYRMFDEPATMPDCLYGDTAALAKPETNVNQSGITCYVDLDGTYCITGVGVFDTYGTGSIAVYDAETDTLLWESNLGGYMSRSLDLIPESRPTSRLKIVKGGGDLNELALYGYPAAQSSLRGDVNADGKVNLADAVLMQRYLLGDGMLVDWQAGDLSADGRLDARDLTMLKGMLLTTWGAHMRPPFTNPIPLLL